MHHDVKLTSVVREFEHTQIEDGFEYTDSCVVYDVDQLFMFEFSTIERDNETGDSRVFQKVYLDEQAALKLVNCCVEQSSNVGKITIEGCDYHLAFMNEDVDSIKKLIMAHA